MLIGKGTEHEAVYRLDGVYIVAFGDPLFVDIARTVHPRNTVVLPGDEAIQTGNYVQRYRRSVAFISA